MWSSHLWSICVGYLNNVATPILCAKGEFHLLEGHSFEDVRLI